MSERGGLPEAAVMIEWVSTPDSRTRDSHRAMHGQKVREGEAFVTPDGYRMRYPGDTELGAPASETIQCRCSFKTTVNWAMVAEMAE